MKRWLLMVMTLWTAHAAGAASSMLFVGVKPGELPGLWYEGLSGAGWKNHAFADWDELTPERLHDRSLVVLVRVPRRAELTAADTARARLLVEYVRAGGGLMLTQAKDQMWTSLTIPQHLAEEFGTRILIEKTVSDPARTRRIGSWAPDEYTFTDRVSGPAASGVTGVLYQSHMDIGSLPGVLPFRPTDPWEVVLAAGPNSRSTPHLVGLDDYDRHARAVGFTANVPLAGVRAFGKGKVAYVGLYSPNIFARPLASAADREVFAVYMGELSRFYLNLFAWLAGPVEGELTMPAVASRELPTAWKLHRGLIGPRTTHSSGRSAPADYVRTAKAAGLDYIVFLEDFAALQPGGFEKLKTECRQLSDATFLAVPGITYQNTDGNHQYAFGGYLKLPSALLLDPTGKRFRVHVSDDRRGLVDLHWLYGLQGFANHSGWYRFRDNPYPHYDARSVDSMAILTQTDGRVVERAVTEFGEAARTGQYLWPVALTLLERAEDVSDRLPVNVIGANGLAQLDEFFSSRSAEERAARHGFPGSPPFGTMFTTTGPLIDLRLPRGDTDPQGDLFSDRLREWPLELTVTAPHGLREVRVMDGDRVIRRFQPRGARRWLFFGGTTNTFHYTTSLSRERQHAIWVHATDTRGGEAISRDITSDSFLLRELQCSDRHNQLLYSMQYRPDRSEFYLGYGGDTAIPDKGPWNGRIRPVGCFVFDKKLGVGAMSYDGSPENHPQALFNPFLAINGLRPPPIGWSRPLVAGVEGAAHVRARRVVASSEVLIGDRILDGVFPVTAAPVIHVWSTLFPVEKSRHLRTTARTTFFLPKVDGFTAYLWEQDFAILRATNAVFHLGEIGLRSATDLRGVPPRGTVRELNAGDHLALLGSPFGSFVMYALSSDLRVEHAGPSLVVSSAQSPARLLLVGLHRLVNDPAGLAAELVRQYGLDGGPPAYRVETEQGQALDQQYALRIAGPFRGRVTGLAGLAGNLGCEITGLNDNWTATLRVGDQTRVVPVENSRAYAVLRAEDDGQPLFIGHPYTASDPRLMLNLTPGALEIHNPTDRAIRAEIFKATGEALGAGFSLPPGHVILRPLP